MSGGKREAGLHHALITVVFMVLIMFVSIVLFDASPHIPLVLGCMAAGLVAVWLGYSWDDILEGMIEGINNSLEAILILLLIGTLVGSWITAGTVPTMICYGLRLVSARSFLPAAMLICLLVAVAIGSWGTVGTIGLAFMGIGTALKIPAPLVAGAVISGAYMGEVISPLSDATNLAAAVVGDQVFSIVKRILPAAITAGAASVLIYSLKGLDYGASSGEAVQQSIKPLLLSIRGQFRITPLALLPMVLIIICILAKMPAIPAMLLGTLAGMIQAAILQQADMGSILEYAYSGYVSTSGNEMIDTLLTAGGMEGMLESISIILIAMAFGGIMRKTRQMEALVKPLISKIRSCGGLNALTVISCIFMNIILPDQYLGISMPGQMYAETYEKRGISKVELAAPLLGGGAVTSPLIPWNTCGIYCMTILGVSPTAYAPYAFFGMILPVITILFGLFKKEMINQRSLEKKRQAIS